MSKLPSSFDGAEISDRDLPFIDRVYKHCREQPIVPLGALLTTGAVILAAKSLRAGHRKDAQKWFRYRVGFQGATIVALVVGGYYYGTVDPSTKRANEDILKEKAKLRERLWIEELERRDAEAKMRKRRAELARAKKLELEQKQQQQQQQQSASSVEAQSGEEEK